MEVLCVRCEGTAVIATKFSFVTGQWNTEPCPDCDGSGYLSSEPEVMPVKNESYSRYVTYRKVK